MRHIFVKFFFKKKYPNIPAREAQNNQTKRSLGYIQ